MEIEQKQIESQYKEQMEEKKKAEDNRMNNEAESKNKK